MAAHHRRSCRSQRNRGRTGWLPCPVAHCSRPDHRPDLPRHRPLLATGLPGGAARQLTPKTVVPKSKMACKPLIINIVQIETAEVGLGHRHGRTRGCARGGGGPSRHAPDHVECQETCDAARLVRDLRQCKREAARGAEGHSSEIEARTTRRLGDAVSGRVRKRIEEVFR
jgi:hypothetical protein